MTSIIILNWNGWEDTIECLTSLKNVKDKYFIILVDNGSTNNSIQHIKEYLANKWIGNQYYIKENEEDHNLSQICINDKDVILYSLKDNYGFAKGNNKGLDLAKKFNPKFGLLLNNDTTVESNFLKNLLYFKKLNPKYKVLTPLILYYFEKDIVWNAGGKLFYGFRKYNYANLNKRQIKEKEFIDISFITGCCLFFDFNLINHTKLLTEKFFHGEEDFEFSIRMKKNKIKMACILNSVIYHKISRSLESNLNLNKYYIHYLNRFINMKHYQTSVQHIIWKLIYIPYIKILLKKKKYAPDTIKTFISSLKYESKISNKVDKEKFFAILNNKF